MNTQNKLAVSTNKIGALSELLNAKRDSIARVLPKHMTPERIIRMALVAASRNPVLLQCDQNSILRAMMDASALGLEPFSPLQHAFIIPYKNNQTGNMEAQFQPGYRGLVDLARRTGQIVTIAANVVREGDLFEYEDGFDQKLKHVPNWTHRGEIEKVYAYALLKDGGRQSVVMTKQEIDGIRAKSKCGKYGPWQDFYEEMAKKTVLKRLCKGLPASTEFAKALEADNCAERGERFINIDMVTDNQIVDQTDGFDPPAAEQPKSKTDTLADKLGG